MNGLAPDMHTFALNFSIGDRGSDRFSKSMKEAGIVRRGFLFSVFMGLLVLSIGIPAHSWQGRMSGMADPYGLISDESDLLIHPAKITKGEGVKFYGDYRFTHTGVTDWDDRYDNYSATGVFLYSQRTDISGDEVGHDGLLGASFPLGQGRMGLFFTCDAMTVDDGGDVFYFDRLEIKSDLDNLALRFLYGLPIGSFRLGAETRIAYRREKDELNHYSLTGAALNQWWIPYKFPHRSRYWEALFKGSVDGKVGPLDIEFTLRGGFDFAGEDKWSSETQVPLGTPVSGYDAKGDVHGWQIGSELWLRYPLAQDLTLPLLVRLDYQAQKRDGDGPDWGTAAGNRFAYKDEQESLALTVGGGMDKEFGKKTRIGAGIYYNYLREREDLSSTFINPAGWGTTGETYPDSVEHQVLLRMAGEYTFSTAADLRAGFNFFYGWVTPKIRYSSNNSAGGFSIEDLSGHDCPHWGVRASLGGTIKVETITLEPFVGGGYRQLHLRAPGSYFGSGGTYGLSNENFTRNEWFVSTGFSVLFGL